MPEVVETTSKPCTDASAGRSHILRGRAAPFELVEFEGEIFAVKAVKYGQRDTILAQVSSAKSHSKIDKGAVKFQTASAKLEALLIVEMVHSVREVPPTGGGKQLKGGGPFFAPADRCFNQKDGHLALLLEDESSAAREAFTAPCWRLWKAQEIDKDDEESEAKKG